MANIHDYLDWRGDLKFEEFGINEIDELILARVSYFPYDRIKMKPKEKFKDIAKKMESFTDNDFIYYRRFKFPGNSHTGSGNCGAYFNSCFSYHLYS